MWAQRKYFYTVLGIIFFFSFSLSYLIANLINGGSKKPEIDPEAASENKIIVKGLITKDTVIKEEIQYLCGTKEVREVPAADLEGLNFKGLQAQYPPEEGWFIDDTVPKNLTLSRQVTGFCPRHTQYRHLGLEQNFLTVYQGPLGFDEIILSREEIPLDILPKDFQAKLMLAENFSSQPAKVQEELREVLEFPNELKLNESMQNFDEYRE